MELSDTNKSLDNFFTVMNDLLDTYAPYKKLPLREIKLVDKRHIIEVKTAIKADLLNKFKNYRN